jgi:uncharacterized glyoxalase superfamily protein PhnB
MPDSAGTPRLGYVIRYVEDVSGAVSFYERAFGLARRFVHASGTYAEMETGATALAFARHDLASSHFDLAYHRGGPDAAPGPSEIALVTDDVPQLFDRAVEAGAAPLLAPVDKPWGQTVAYVRDADGAIVELCTPVNP